MGGAQRPTANFFANVNNEHLENCKAPIRLPIGVRPLDELWVDSGCKYAVHGGVPRTVSTAGKSQSSEFGIWASFITFHFKNT